MENSKKNGHIHRNYNFDGVYFNYYDNERNISYRDLEIYLVFTFDKVLE